MKFPGNRRRARSIRLEVSKTSPESLEFGCDNVNGGNPFNGAIDEVKLYDIVLTPVEVLALAGK